MHIIIGAISYGKKDLIVLFPEWGRRACRTVWKTRRQNFGPKQDIRDRAASENILKRVVRFESSLQPAQPCCNRDKQVQLGIREGPSCGWSQTRFRNWRPLRFRFEWKDRGRGEFAELTCWFKIMISNPYLMTHLRRKTYILTNCFVFSQFIIWKVLDG